MASYVAVSAAKEEAVRHVCVSAVSVAGIVLSYQSGYISQRNVQVS